MTTLYFLKGIILFVFLLWYLYKFWGIGRDDVDSFEKEKKHHEEPKIKSKIFCKRSKKHFWEGVSRPKITLEILEVDWFWVSAYWFSSPYYSIYPGIHTLTIERLEEKNPYWYFWTMLSKKKFLEKIEINILEGENYELSYNWEDGYIFCLRWEK